MDYISTVQASKKWNITTNRITILCNEGRIDGAFQIGTRWFIPSSAPKPKDGRYKESKTINKENRIFRYYLYDLKDPAEYNPPLSNEEIIIKEGCSLFHECRFEDANKMFDKIDIRSCSIYSKIYTLFGRCLISTMIGQTNNFQKYYELLNIELQNDFPNKKELSFLPHEIDGILGATKYYINEFKIDETYPYHESFLPHLTYLSLISYLFSNKSFKEKDLEAYELALSFIDKTVCIVDSQTIHCYLGIIYHLVNNENKSKYHIYKSLEIGQNHKLYWLPSLVLFYYNKVINPVLKTFSKEYYDKISFLNNDIRKRFNMFSNKMQSNNFFNILLSNEYIYVFYAIQGYTNKEVANILKTSESYVNNRYSYIYQTLNINSKKELIDYYLKSNTSSLLIRE